MAKRVAAGFISCVSPKKPCANGSCQYKITMQDGENSSINIQGFGDDSFSKISNFAKSKSPVKVSLFQNPGYNSLVFNERSNLLPAKFYEVPFQYKDMGSAASQPSESVQSLPVDIAAIQNIQPNDVYYYTISGKLELGSNATKQVNGTHMKDDNLIFDKTENIRISLWEPLLSEVVAKQMYEISHLKLRNRGGVNYLTTSPKSTIKIMPDDPNIKIPEDITFDSFLASLKVSEVQDVGLKHKYSCCNVCNKKVHDSEIRVKSFTCNSCRKSYRILKLGRNIMVSITVLDDNGNPISLTIPKEVLTKVLGEVKEEEIDDELLDLTDITIEYSKETKLVSKIEKS